METSPLNYEWETRNLQYRGHNIKLIALKHLELSNLDQILETVDKSSEGLDINKVDKNFNGLFREKDVLCVNEKLLLWFSAAEKKNRSVRTGGGLISGIWELKNLFNKVQLKSTQNISYAPNLLLPGSKPGIKLFGADVYGGYSNKKTIWGLENAMHLQEGPKMGHKIFDSDRGPYSSDGGVFIEYTGVISNSGIGEEGFDTEYDTDPRPGVVGRTSFSLVYRIPSNKGEIIQEIKFKAEENNFGPISTAYMALYLPGYEEKFMSWASNPEIIPRSEELNLKDVSKNKYFRNTAVSKIFFYKIKHTHHPEKKLAAQTPEGRGRILCLGSPEHNINFLCGYPTNDYIPPETYEEYTLELSDNQTISKYGKFHSLNYKLINSPNKSITLNKDQSFIMIMRYKLIDASSAAAAVDYRKQMEVNEGEINKLQNKQIKSEIDENTKED